MRLPNLELFSRCHVVCLRAVPHRCSHFAASIAQGRYSCSYPLCSRRTCQRICLFGYFIASDYVSLQHSKGISGACHFTLFPARGHCRNRFVDPVRSGVLCQLKALTGLLSIFAPEALDFFSNKFFSSLSRAPAYAAGTTSERCFAVEGLRVYAE